MAKVEPEVVQDEENDNPFEAVRFVRTRFLGGSCPFRGQPFVPPLDHRCPSTVPAVGLPTFDRPKGEGAIAMMHAVPHIPENSYCHECLHDQVREEEAGRNPSRRPVLAGKKRR